MRFHLLPLFCLLSASIGSAQSTWTGNGSGNWSDPADWTGGVPDNINAIANLIPAASSTFITVDESVYVGQLNISSTNSLYLIQGSSPLTLATSTGQAQLTNTSGNNIILAPVSLANDSTFTIAIGSSLTISANLSARGLNLTKTGGGTLDLTSVRANSLNISQGSMQILSNGTSSALSVVHAFTLAANSTLDLENNSLIVDYTNGSPLAKMTSEIAAAYDGGKWDKPGITSSAASFAQGTTLGIGDASTLGITTYENEPVPSSVIVKYTWYGDTNLDGTVNSTDLSRLQNGMQNHLTGWTNGDFNYDGVINADDFALFILGNTKQNSVLGNVPEPTLAAIVGSIIIFFKRKR